MQRRHHQGGGTTKIRQKVGSSPSLTVSSIAACGNLPHPSLTLPLSRLFLLHMRYLIYLKWLFILKICPFLRLSMLNSHLAWLPLFCAVAPMLKSHPVSFCSSIGLWLQVYFLGIRPCLKCRLRSFVGCAPMFVYHPCVFVVPFLCVWYWCIHVQNVPCMCLKIEKSCVYTLSLCD